MSGMNIQEIMTMLPHRYPFLLVDRVLEIDLEQRRIVALKNVTVNEPYFQGHFPGSPIMPGVLQLEALAQAGGILFNKLTGRGGKISYYTGVDKARWRRMVNPGDSLRLEVTIDRIRLGMARMTGKVWVGDELATEAEMLFRLAED